MLRRADNEHIRTDFNAAFDAIGTMVVSHLADGTQHAKTARFVVGTSTAGWTVADCDYLCDGTADQSEINSAITALPATGGEIVILDGTYNITAKIDVTKDNVSIRGSGNATILKRMFNSSVPEGVITLAGRSGCKISNLQIDGNQVNYPYNENGGDIFLESSNNNTVTDNTCNNGNFGIYLFDSSNNIVTGNTSNDNGLGIGLNSSSANTVTDNTSNNNNFGIRLDASSNNTITGNTCNDNQSNGIGLNSSSDNTVTSNTSNNNNDIGIFLESSNNNTVTGNTCYNNYYTGISLYESSNNNTVTGNTCYNNNYSGIDLYGSINNTITGNTCIRESGLATDYTASQNTIQLMDTDNNYNLISNNNCMGKAVAVDGGTGNTIIDNKWSDSSGRILENYSENLVTLSGTSTTVDLSLGNVFTHTLSGNTTYTISNAVSGVAHSFTLIITQPATPVTLTFPASVKWQGGEIPDLSTANKTYVLTFMTVDGGTNWLGMFGGEF